MTTIKELKEMNERLARIETKIEVIEVEVGMLKRVVYGAVSVVLLAVLTVAMKFILVQP